MMLLIFTQGGNGTDYWKFVFTGFSIGSFGIMSVMLLLRRKFCLTYYGGASPSFSLAFLALNVSIVQAVPPQASGVAGALLQTSLQIGKFQPLIECLDPLTD